jgi:hypothetical protein
MMDAGKRASARFYLDHIVFPVLDSIAKDHGVRTEEQIALMIRNKDTLGNHLDDPRLVEKLNDIMKNPGVRFLLGRFKGYLEYSRQQVFSSLPWWMERIEETRPSFHRVLMEEPGGSEWFGDTLYGVIELFRKYVK